jgi:hypothetical protein
MSIFVVQSHHLYLNYLLRFRDTFTEILEMFLTRKHFETRVIHLKRVTILKM